MITTLFALALVSQSPIPVQNPVDSVRPGAPIWSGSIACSTSTTVYFEYEWDGAGGHSGYMLFPEGSVVTLENQDTSNNARCAVTAHYGLQIGAQTNATSRDDGDDRAVGNGDTVIAGIPLRPGSGASVTLTFNAFSKRAGARTNICTTPVSGRALGNDIEVYGQCYDAAECNNKGGVPSSTACSSSATDPTVTINDTLNPVFNTKTRLRGFYIGCKCGSTNQIDAWITR